jgi:AcrR family transcriptional regulator
MDRRVRRTRRILGDALLELIVEQGYEQTTVQDVLDRADVGRSTFYAHFRDKDALLMAGFDEMAEQLRTDLAAMAPGIPPEPGQPVQALFLHAYRNQPVYTALCGRRGGPAFRRRLHDLVAGLLREHLTPHLAAARADLPVDVVVEFATGAALGLLVWWVDSGYREHPQRMAHLYQRLAAPGVTRVVDAHSQLPGPPQVSGINHPDC